MGYVSYLERMIKKCLILEIKCLDAAGHLENFPLVKNTFYSTSQNVKKMIRRAA